ncbi:MAG: glycosyltransferase family 2 protein [Acidobacteriota bacterium]|jgi:dolichyl-phosphate beta-glucosyltransferase
MVESSNIRLSVVIPAYNEELRLPRTLEDVLAYLKAQPYRSEIIVVNDGSGDATERVVLEQDPSPVLMEVLQHPDGRNHGKGASVKRGIMASHGTFRLFMDADNSTALNQVDSFWPFFDRGFDVVIGSRALEDSVIDRHQSRMKEIAGRLGNWLVRTLAVPGIFDTQAGFKMFTSKAVERIFPRLTIDTWGYDIELLVIAQSLGYRIREVPITWRNASGSKVTVGTYFEVLAEIWRIRRNLKSGLYR